MTRLDPGQIAGVVVIKGELFVDHRGDFRKIVTLSDVPMETRIEQVATATNTMAGTLRGMHFQAAPFDEAKTVWCVRGAAFDVLVDVRPDQSTFGDWAAVELDASKATSVHVPPGVAHGYQTLVDATTLAYLISAPYAAARQQTLAWDDPSVAIEWPLDVASMSDSDRAGCSWPPPH